jgi:hypothetical protein
VESDLPNISVMGESSWPAIQFHPSLSEPVTNVKITGIKIGEHEKPQSPNTAFHEQ